MESINFKDSFKEYAVNGDKSRVIRVRIDPGMPEKIESALAEIDNLTSDLSEKNFTEMGAKFCGIINRTFGSDVCTPAFDGGNPFSVVENGQFLYEVFFNAFMPVLEANIKECTENIHERVNKYTKKS